MNDEVKVDTFQLRAFKKNPFPTESNIYSHTNPPMCVWKKNRSHQQTRLD